MTQTLLTIFVPTLTVLLGILLNRNDAAKMEVAIRGDMAKLDSQLSAVENRLDNRMTSLKGRFHADMLMVIGKLTELEVRVAKMETTGK